MEDVLAIAAAAGFPEERNEIYEPLELMTDAECAILDDWRDRHDELLKEVTEKLTALKKEMEAKFCLHCNRPPDTGFEIRGIDGRRYVAWMIKRPAAETVRAH